MSEHTPGPWAWQTPVYLVGPFDPDEETHVPVMACDRNWQPRTADRSMIAASPLMLAALEAALARFRYIRTGGTGVEFADPAYLVGNEDVIRQLAAAIQAAKGE